jgi:hypothetical protein
MLQRTLLVRANKEIGPTSIWRMKAIDSFTDKGLKWVISARCGRSGLPAHVRFAPKATDVPRCREMAICADFVEEVGE